MHKVLHVEGGNNYCVSEQSPHHKYIHSVNFNEYLTRSQLQIPVKI